MSSSGEVLQTMIDLRKELSDTRSERDQLAWSAGTERRQADDIIAGLNETIATMSKSETTLHERLVLVLAECDQYQSDFIKAAEQATQAYLRIRELEADLRRGNGQHE